MEAKPSSFPTFEERHADLGGSRLRYYVGGAGEPLLLVHGLGGAASNWVTLAGALALRRRVVVPDLPGHGGSAPLPETPGVEAFAGRLGLLAELEGMLPVPIVGHSAGGLLALRLALQRPEAVSGIVLAASAGISTTRQFARLSVEALTAMRPGRAVAPFSERIARTPALRYLAFGWWGASDPPALSAAATEGFLAGQALHTDTRKLGRALVADDPRDDLASVSCPCLVLWGARDNWVPLRDGFEFARRLGAPLRVIPDCGHLLIGERPDACLDAIMSFLPTV